MTDHSQAGTAGAGNRGHHWLATLLLALAAAVLGGAFAVGGARLMGPDASWNPFRNEAAIEAALPASRADVRQLTHEVLQARAELRALQDEITALLADPDTDWEELAVRGRTLAMDCNAAEPLPPVPQREAGTAYRTAAAVLHGQHPAFALAGSWPVAVALEDGTRLLLRVVPAVLSFMPEWPAGRAVAICFAWLDGASQPLLLADLARPAG